MPTLNGDQTSVELAPGVFVVAPGLRGEVDVQTVPDPGGRGPEDPSQALLDALDQSGMTQDVSIEIHDHTETSVGTGSRAAGGADDIELTVTDPGPGYGQVVLYTAEDGSLSWHAPSEATAAGGRGSGSLTYRIPSAVVEPPAAEVGSSRGLVGVIGRKVIKVLFFKVLETGAGMAANRIARHAESARRPHALRPFDATSVPAPLDAQGLQDLTDGPALLLIHGTASSTRQAFGKLPDDAVAELHRRYGGRLFALDHPTISVDPHENVAWLSHQLASLGERRLTLDIISHSRGGLVGRLLTEHPELTEGRVEVRRLVMVAAPNNGTALAQSKHLGHLVDRLTNLLQFVPSNGVTDTMEIVLEVVKHIAVGAFDGLDGLSCMRPDGSFLTDLNDGPAVTGTSYFAAAANFEPPEGSPLLRVARDGATDIVFGLAHNDLVVPTDGVAAVSGGQRFSVADSFEFADVDGVDHSGFWTRDPFLVAMRDWLPET